MTENDWCKNCIRVKCIQTVEECKRTPEVTTEQIYQAMIRLGKGETT